jgi:hypothetical protein
MSLSNLMGLLQRYVDPSGSNSENAVQDFQHVAQNAPPASLASGLANAFRSDQTPPFAQMLSNMFNNSNGEQRAGILNHLLGAVGPSAGAGILGNLGGLLGGGSHITPEQAQQVPPEAVHQLAEQAERNNPSIVDQVSRFYAEHPTLVQGLGAGALALIMSHMSRNSGIFK